MTKFLKRKGVDRYSFRNLTPIAGCQDRARRESLTGSFRASFYRGGVMRIAAGYLAFPIARNNDQRVRGSPSAGYREHQPWEFRHKLSRWTSRGSASKCAKAV